MTAHFCSTATAFIVFLQEETEEEKKARKKARKAERVAAAAAAIEGDISIKKREKSDV